MYRGDPFGLADYRHEQRARAPEPFTEKVVGPLYCQRCAKIMYQKPTEAQKLHAPKLCELCYDDVADLVERRKHQAKAANKLVHCPKCMTEYRAIDMPDPGKCGGCARDAQRQAKLEERRKNPPMCTKCKEEEDADVPMYPGLCMRCLDRQMDEEMENEEIEEEAERKRDDEEWAAKQAEQSETKK